MLSDNDIRHFLDLSLTEAEKAFRQDNYPIGSLVVDSNNKIISQQRNQCVINNDVTAHAEILNLKEIKASKLGDLIMFSSLEPCFGCSFFIARSNIKKIYSALKDPHKDGISDLKKQTQFEDFFKNIEIFNEPFDDLKTRSKNLMKEYF